MKFSDLSSCFQKLENTASRNFMTEILGELFLKAQADEIDKICYLTQGRVAPLFIPLEFGMADKMVIKAISLAYGIDKKEVENIFKKEGDLGKTAEKFISQRATVARQQFYSKSAGSPVCELGHDSSKIGRVPCALPVIDVFSVLEEIAKSSGAGSVDRKTKLLADLLKSVDSLSARYIVRIPLAKMRLGFSDMTVLDGLSWMLGKNKEARKEIEKAYNVRPDLGFIARLVKEKGIKGIRGIGPEMGVPILMAKAERLSSGKEIIDKIGKCAVEGKYDGFRLQVHYSKNSKFQIPNSKFQNEKLFEEQEQHVSLYSRNLEDVTVMYPDIADGVTQEIKVDEAIFEGEAIGWDEKNERYLPFQETVQRKRKYDIAAMSKSVPLRLIVFDLLYLDGENLIGKPFLERRKKIESVISN